MALLQKAYLGATPLFRNTSFFVDNAYTVSNRSSRVTVTANASAHVKGSWVQLIASTSADASLIYLDPATFANGTNSSCLLDIGTGASGSEVALVSNLAIGGSRYETIFATNGIEIPIQVPSGTRLSARIQHTTGGTSVTVGIEARNYGDYAQAPTSVDVIGTDTATSTGTNFVANNTYVQVTASTSRAYRAIVMIPNVSGSDIGTFTSDFTLAKGASGSEVEIATRIAGYANAESVTPRSDFLIPTAVPAGTPLAVKFTGAGSNWSRYGVSLIGIP
jgi:hypothetical protein